jgi:hypothetical protein
VERGFHGCSASVTCRAETTIFWPSLCFILHSAAYQQGQPHATPYHNMCQHKDSPLGNSRCQCLDAATLLSVWEKQKYVRVRVLITMQCPSQTSSMYWFFPKREIVSIHSKGFETS